MWADLRTRWLARQWALFFLALTPPNLRAGRLPFVFFAGLFLMVVIGMLWLLTPNVGSQESRLTFIAFIALSLGLLNMGVSTQRVLTLVGVYATVHIGLAAYYGQGIFSPRVNWLYLIPILMFHIDGRRSGLLWGGVVMAVFSLLAAFNHWEALPHWTPMTQGHGVYAFLVYAVTATCLIAITLTYQGFSAKAIAALRTSNEELEARRQELQKILDIRDRFISSVSHELRTPLASLMGFVETLRGPAADDPPAQTRFLAIMAEQAARMNRLIDDLLSLSRIELSEHTPPGDSVDLGAVVSRVLAGFEVRLAERRQKLAVDVAAELPRVVADGDQMAQVLSNLVENAMKYGREGGTVAVSLLPATAGVMLAVRDDGPGVARVHIPRLTERFYRVDKGRSRNAGGTGLGLAIVKHIVNRHRGRLVIESEEGNGATFSVWLPLSPES